MTTSITSCCCRQTLVVHQMLWPKWPELQISQRLPCSIEAIPRKALLDSDRGEGLSAALHDLPRPLPSLATAMRASMPDAAPRAPSSAPLLFPFLLSALGSGLRRAKAAEPELARHECST